ncbi:MAG: peptide deformylase, partial [Prochloraceae cyanobacterium]
MAELLEIAQLGNPILRQVAQPVSNPNDRSIRKLIDSLIATAASVSG